LLAEWRTLTKRFVSEEQRIGANAREKYRVEEGR
jgi:hypothetical protein